MLFTQLEFAVFFAIVFLVSLGNFRFQKTFLLVASYYFYGYWDWRFLLLIAGCTLLNWYAAERISAANSRNVRKAWMVFALAASLGALGFFKYYNFFVHSLNALMDRWGWSMGSLRIILPVGISFFTFQTLSYTVDVYRGDLKNCRSLQDFALYVAFFPQLVAGPIVRASEFLPQLETPRKICRKQIYEGGRIFIFGFFKKVFLADRLAQFVDVIFSHAGAFDGLSVWLGVLAYAVQIYCDFSGYSDMAIGLARILGYEFSVNFNLPYISKSIQEFWHRWHISLSTWLRDYLYIPLGGNRRGRARTYVNLLVTMILGGLWHGASWTFVFWGGLHGVALAVNRRWIEWRGQRMESGSGAVFRAWAGRLATLLVVLIGWVFFRSGTFAQASLILGKMFTMDDGFRWIHPFAFAVVLGVILQHVLLAWPRRPAWINLPSSHWVTPGALVFLLGLSILFYPTGFAPFIYFQF